MDEHRLTSMVENEKSLNKLIFSVASSMEVNNTEKLKILQTDTHEDRIKLLNHILSMKNDELKVTRDVKFKNIIFEIEDKVRNDLVEQSKRIILKKQLDQINKEL
jgi:ATP-dependent Lon protease